MADHIVFALPDGRWLSLDREAFAAALAAGMEITASVGPPTAAPAEPLLDAAQAAVPLGVKARLLDDYARAGLVPHYKVGRFVRFRVSEVAAHFHVLGASPPTDSLSVTPLRRLGRQ